MKTTSIAIALLLVLPAANADPAVARVGIQATSAELPSSPAARRVVAWAIATRDAGGLPFFVVDKPQARLYVFDSKGALRGTSPILLGLARGDRSVPGIGERAMSQIRPHERTTPAGRFVAERGHNAAGEDIFWVDYEDAVSLHRVRATNPKERRLQRLATPTIADNRISYGCINVPKDFYERVVDTTPGSRVVVYVLPDRLPLQQVFTLDDPPAGTARRAVAREGRSGP